LAIFERPTIGLSETLANKRKSPHFLEGFKTWCGLLSIPTSIHSTLPFEFIVSHCFARPNNSLDYLDLRSIGLKYQKN
jgi:hypothetical protein